MAHYQTMDLEFAPQQGQQRNTEAHFTQLHRGPVTVDRIDLQAANPRAGVESVPMGLERFDANLVFGLTA